MKRLAFSTIILTGAVVSFSALTTFVVEEPIRKRLTHETYHKLKRNGFHQIKVQFNGRDGLVTGTLSKEKYPQFVKTLKSIKDARVIHDNTSFQSQEVRELRPIEREKLTFHKEIPQKVEAFEVLFGTNSYSLEKYKKEMSSFIDNKSSIQYLIQGHADMRGEDGSNFLLATRRAHAIHHLLVESGVNPKNIKIQSFGERNPASSGLNLEKNRRVIIQKFMKSEEV